MAALLFLLCSGFFHFTFASNHLRSFRFPETYSNRSYALAACNETHESFVTLYDEEDAIFIHNFLYRDGTVGNVWLGLRRTRKVSWSDGSPVNFTNSSVTVGNLQTCQAIDIDTWTGFNCSDRRYFMCYEGNNYTLVEKNKTWCQALEYCREHFTDLVRIRTDTENKEVIKVGKNTSFWIGLLHDQWEWEDNGCSSFRKWASEKSGPGNCTTIIHFPPRLLYEYSCTDDVYSFCSKGSMRIRVINVNLTWEDAFNYCKDKYSGPLWIEDAEDQAAVAQWLNYTNNTGLFWMGLRQSRVFGFWIWSDRTVSYSNWKNDKEPEMSTSNPCGAIDGTDYMWRDKNCLLKLPFLCEEKIIYMNPTKKEKVEPDSSDCSEECFP